MAPPGPRPSTAPLAALGLDRGSFPFVDCPACGQRALVYLDVSGDRDVERCLACHAPATPDRIGQAGTRAVERLGYVFLDEHRQSKAARKLSGCGARGVRSCGSGGCSSGTCGSGGCASGGCRAG